MRVLKSHETDLTVGPIMKNLILYSLPLIGVNILQLVFSAADIVVLGMFSSRSDSAVAAVGATTALINLVLGLFIGISIGANVAIARSKGANDIERSRRLVGTSIFAGLSFGIIILLVGFFLAEKFMLWMKCDLNVIDLAVKYLKIYFLGAPIIMLYNFSAAIMRATGDTFRPFIYLIIGGVLNVILNIFFITVLGMDVDGVAIATVASQAISAALACFSLFKSDGHSKFSFKYFRIYKKELIDIIKIGVPVGLSKCFFSLSNVTLQSAINKLGENVMTAHSIGHQIDAFSNEALHALSLASLAFISQNLGAEKIDRVKKTIFCSYTLITLVGLLMGGLVCLMAPTISKIMTDSEEIIKLSCQRIYILGGTSVFCGIMNLSQETLRGLGKSFLSMFIALMGSCVLRILYINTIYLLKPVQEMVYIAYPTTWFVTAVAMVIAIIPMYKKQKNRIMLKQSKEEVVRETEQSKEMTI